MTDEPPVVKSDDYGPNLLRMYDNCSKCDHDDHICGGCGTPLTHSGHERTESDGYFYHGTRCVD